MDDRFHWNANGLNVAQNIIERMRGITLQNDMNLPYGNTIIDSS